MRVLGTRYSTDLQGLVLLAPSVHHVPPHFESVLVSPRRHARLLAELQRFRGDVYLRDGAIQPAQLSSDGRHHVPADDDSWHLLALQSGGQVAGCARYREHDLDVCPESLSVWRSALAQSAAWRSTLRAALAEQIAAARARGVAYVEVGGWAIARSRRYSQDAVAIALSTYALAAALGGCLGITTATTRHASNRILGKLGGKPLEHDGVRLPSYFDGQFECEMEFLRFDSSITHPAYASRISRLSAELTMLPVLCPAPIDFQRPLPVGSSERHGSAELATAICLT